VLNLVYLCRSYGLEEPAAYWEGVTKVNDYQMQRFARAIVARLFDTVSGKRIALLGFAFKKDTGDVRESAAAYVAALLLAERAELRAHDPKADALAMALETRAAGETMGLGLDAAACLGLGAGAGGPAPLFSMHEDALAACEGAHAVVVLTEWPQFRALDWRRVYAACSKPAFVFDGRNLLDHAALRALGFEVQGIGKPQQPQQAAPGAAAEPAAAAEPGAGAAAAAAGNA